MQQRQICIGAKSTISCFSFIIESQILNNICCEDFKGIIENPILAFEKLGIGN
jgi:hypothetical protein